LWVLSHGSRSSATEQASCRVAGEPEGPGRTDRRPSRQGPPGTTMPERRLTQPAGRFSTPSYTAQMGHWSESLVDEAAQQIGGSPDRRVLTDLLAQRPAASWRFYPAVASIRCAERPQSSSPTACPSWTSRTCRSARWNLWREQGRSRTR
jgi:hypothetical protein